MTHFHDADIKKALIELAPDEKEAIEQAAFGEIKGS
jgi:carbonic anhydrase